MKRIYACLCIVAVLLSIAFYSSWRVQKFAEDISDDIDDAVEALRDEDLPAARQALAEGAKLCDEMREGRSSSRMASIASSMSSEISSANFCTRQLL